MSGDMGNPEGPRDDEAREFPPPPPAESAQQAEPSTDSEVPGASVAAAEDLPPAASDDRTFDDLAASRVDDLDIPPAAAAVPDFTVPDPPEIPPLDATAVDLLEDENASSSEIDEVSKGSEPADPVPATRSELRARASAIGADATSTPDPRPAADPVPASSTTAAPAFAPEPTSAAAPFAAAPTEMPASDLPDAQGGDTYRGWPFVIFALLLALLIAAVIGVIVLANNPPSLSAPESVAVSTWGVWSAGVSA